MKRAILATTVGGLLILGGLYVALTQFFPNSILNHRFSWAEIKEHGGLAVGDPVLTGSDQWFVPLSFDATGLSKLTSPPATIDSFTAVRRLRWRVEDNKLFVSVYRSIPTFECFDRRTYGVYVRGRWRGKTLSVVYDDGATTHLRDVSFSSPYKETE